MIVNIYTSIDAYPLFQSIDYKINVLVIFYRAPANII